METLERHKCGDVREDGMVFVRCHKGCFNGEWWVTPEKFAAMREKNAERMRSRYANDPEYRERVVQRERKRRAEEPGYREKQAEYARSRRANDPAYRENAAEFKRRYIRERRGSDPLYATSLRLRARTRQAFRRLAADKPASTEELLGTNWQTLKAHIEAQFVNGMSWGNMSEWHIDHIVPLASAQTEEELAGLCHYTNLQPLWASDNLSKGAKLPHELTN